MQYLYLIHIGAGRCRHAVLSLLLAPPFLLPTHRALLPPHGGRGSAPRRPAHLRSPPSQTEPGAQRPPFPSVQTEENPGDTSAGLFERRKDRGLPHDLRTRTRRGLDGFLSSTKEGGKIKRAVALCRSLTLAVTTVVRYSPRVSHTVSPDQPQLAAV